ncbi:MAG: cbb3-type cytochrome c oxidase subunit 3 [Ectothiorhodospiraceae bacterium]|jgi:cytochrome c oxidase cbb3-type subunit 4
MDSGTLSGIMTAILLVLFIGIVVWAYSSKRRKDFDEAAQLPFSGDEAHPASNSNKEGTGHE